MCDWSPESQLYPGLCKKKCDQQVYSALGRPHLAHCIQLWNPQHMDLLEQVQRRSTKKIRWLVHLSCEERLKEFVVVQPGNKKALGTPC